MKPPFAYYGGKTLLAERIAAALPAHRHYVEPFAGSLAVLLAKPRSLMETVNDLDREDCSNLTAADDLEVARRVWTRLAQGRAGRLMRSGWRHYVDPRQRRHPVSELPRRLRRAHGRRR